MEDRHDELKKQHADLQAQVKDIQKTFDTERAAWANDKKTLEGTIFDMTTSEKNIESDRASRESAIREQEERAKEAEERYSREVLAHAEAIKSTEDLRQQLNKALASARDGQAASETAQAKLSASEASWKQQKEALDKEIADLNTRYGSPSSYIFATLTPFVDARTSLRRIAFFINIWNLLARKPLVFVRRLIHQHLRRERAIVLMMLILNWLSSVLSSRTCARRRKLSTCNSN